MTINTKYASLLGFTKHYIFLLPLASLLLLASCGGGGGGNPSAKTSPSNLSIADAATLESAGVVELIVTLNPTSDSATSFYYRTQDGSATTSDYTSVTKKTASIAAGASTTTISITIIDDATVEDAESFVVEILDSSSNSILDTATATIKISDLSLAITDATALESAGKIEFIVSLNALFTGSKAVSFNYRTLESDSINSASADADYTSKDGRATIDSGELTTSILIDISNDSEVEEDETFYLVISNPHNATIDKNKASATGTIKIDDLPSLSIADATTLEGTGSIKFRVSLSDPFPGGKDVVFNYKTRETTSTEVANATAGADYTSDSGRATINSGELTTSISIDISNDTIIEDDETFYLVISNPQPNITITRGIATGTIKINGLSLSIADATTLEGAGKIEFIVSLSAPFPGGKDVVFNYETRETTSTEVANAIADADYTSDSGRATIDSVTRTTSIFIDIKDDSLVEDNETFLVVISTNKLDIPIIKPQAIGTIKIDELPSLSITDATASENTGVLTFTARLSEPFSHNTAVSFDYQTKRGSANNKIVWQTATGQAAWSKRQGHSSVVFDGKIWVLGGNDGSRRNDVYYSSDGSNWHTATTDAAWSARHFHTSVVFNGKIWVLGGNDGSRRNDVYYSSDGSNWHTATEDAAWSVRTGHSSVVFKNKIWVMGGYSGSNKNDVYYSSDGSNWHTATEDAAWSGRSNHSSVVFNDKIWLLGGNEGRGANGNPPGGRKNDVWYSTDGINWYPATTAAAWSIRQRHSSVVFDGKIWVLGGLDSYTNNNVWYSSNGADWSKLPAESSWAARRSHSSVVFGNKIWVLGGYDDGSTSRFNDVYFADATGDYFSASGSSSIPGGERSTTINITLLDDDILEPADETFDIIISNPVNATIDTAAGDNQATGTIADIAIWTEVDLTMSTKRFSAKNEHSSVVTRYNGENLMWVIGGKRNNKATTTTHYSADGISWTKKEGNFFAREGHSSVVHSFDSKNYIFILGGKNKDGIKNQIFRSTQNPTLGWQLMNNLSTEEKRYAHSSVVFDGKIWMLGGKKTDDSNKNDVYSGSVISLINLDFTKVKANNNTGWSARSKHTSVVFDGKIWVLGGNDGSNKNDVWSSTDGITWTEATTDANWSARSEHTSVVFDNKIWVLGGSDGSNKNDVWYSADGKNWGKVTTTSTTWSVRSEHTSVVFDGKIWVLGGSDGSDKNDVWHLSE